MIGFLSPNNAFRFHMIYIIQNILYSKLRLRWRWQDIQYSIFDNILYYIKTIHYCILSYQYIIFNIEFYNILLVKDQLTHLHGILAYCWSCNGLFSSKINLAMDFLVLRLILQWTFYFWDQSLNGLFSSEIDLAMDFTLPRSISDVQKGQCR